MKLNENNIQNAIYRYASQLQHNYMCPNVYVYNWESDFISCTKAGYVHEYEIKISRSDFKADSKKVNKHIILSNGCIPANGRIAHEIFRNVKLNEFGEVIKKRPNYFWYVCPEGLIKIDDINKKYGLMWINQYGDSICSKVIKSPERLHNEKLSDNISNHITTSLGYKYWNLRLNNDKTT